MVFCYMLPNYFPERWNGFILPSATARYHIQNHFIIFFFFLQKWLSRKEKKKLSELLSLGKHHTYRKCLVGHPSILSCAARKMSLGGENTAVHISQAFTADSPPARCVKIPMPFLFSSLSCRFQLQLWSWILQCALGRGGLGQQSRTCWMRRKAGSSSMLSAKTSHKQRPTHQALAVNVRSRLKSAPSLSSKLQLLTLLLFLPRYKWLHSTIPSFMGSTAKRPVI